MKVQVVTINSVQKSSKSELSSGTFGHFKVYEKAKGLTTRPAKSERLNDAADKKLKA